MPDWRQQILNEFTPKVSRLTLFADPDGLLSEEGMLQSINERGFDVLSYEDSILFRYVYETKHRVRWDRGENNDLVIVINEQMSGLARLPFDILSVGRKLSFGLGALFPNLSYPVVASLDRSEISRLYEAYNRQTPARLGENATKDFILLHVYDIAIDDINDIPDLLRVLLRRHYVQLDIPALIEARLIQVVSDGKKFDDWPLEQIISDRQAFLSFLQERWPKFLIEAAGGESSISIAEDKHHEPLAFGGPSLLPLGHKDVRVYLDNFFSEGLLEPVVFRSSAKIADKWVSIGVKSDPKGDRLRRLGMLAKTMENGLPPVEARHQDWLKFAYRWAELILLTATTDVYLPEPMAQHIADLKRQVDERFLSWVLARYGGLHNQPAVPPVMLHHIPRALARLSEENSAAKVALVVVDGLSIDQWLVLREEFQSSASFRFEEGAVFAWLPTITSVSRQTIFAGKPPLYFPNSLFTTEREDFLWSQFWTDHGIQPNAIKYIRGLGDDNLEKVTELATLPSTRVLGIVVDKVDRIMHGMELGTAGMHNQIRQWASKGYMRRLLELLIKLQFRIVITSDHGNIEAQGIGRPKEGSLADVRGERVRIYSDERLRAGVRASFPESIEWPSLGLPDNFLPLFAPGRTAFIANGERLVAHGGISVEELMVPYIQISEGPPA